VPQPLKNPGLAAVLSFFWAGLGQIYNGHIGKAILFMIIEGILWIITFATLFIGVVLLIPFWIYNIWDAYKSAERFNNSQAAA